MKSIEDSRNFFPQETISCGPWPDNLYGEMVVVEEWRGFKVGMEVGFARFGEEVRGVILAIGENAQNDGGEVFTAFMIRCSDSGITNKTHREIHHVI